MSRQTATAAATLMRKGVPQIAEWPRTALLPLRYLNLWSDVSDNLRDRIAAVLRERVACGHHETYEDVADAVIEALPVIKALPQRVEWRADFGYDGYAKCETCDEARARVDEFNAALGDDVRDGEQAMVMYRFVTDWVAGE